MCRKVPDEASVSIRVTAARLSPAAAAMTMDLLTKPLKKGKAEMAKAPTM